MGCRRMAFHFSSTVPAVLTCWRTESVCPLVRSRPRGLTPSIYEHRYTTDIVRAHLTTVHKFCSALCTLSSKRLLFVISIQAFYFTLNLFLLITRIVWRLVRSWTVSRTGGRERDPDNQARVSRGFTELSRSCPPGSLNWRAHRPHDRFADAPCSDT